MGSLLDCNVLSELRKGSRCAREVQKWFDEQPEDGLFVSVITLGEISGGTVRVPERAPPQPHDLMVVPRNPIQPAPGRSGFIASLSPPRLHQQPVQLLRLEAVDLVIPHH